MITRESGNIGVRYIIESMQTRQPLLIAHRGDCQNYPENSMAAFKSAFDKGADGVELDMHERNGQLIIVHHYSHSRSEAYPTIPAVLEEFASRGRLEIEIKTMSLSFIDPLKAALENYQAANIELTTSIAGLFAYLKPAFPHFKVGCIFPQKEFEEWMFEENDFYVRKVTDLMRLHKADIAHLPFSVCSELMIKSLRQDGYLIHTNIAGKSDERQVEMHAQAQALGIDQITFDYMGLL